MAAKPSQGQIRIIGGEWRGRKLAVANAPGLRPTSDRVRETLFNWLQFQIPGLTVLDLFAGTGALGLEALSRGAAHVSFCESDSAAIKGLEQALQVLNAGSRARVFAGDARASLARFAAAGTHFDLVFMDPPFSDHLHESVLGPVTDRVNAGGWLYLESPITSQIEVGAPWTLHRQGTTRDVRFALYRKST